MLTIPELELLIKLYKRYYPTLEGVDGTKLRGAHLIDSTGYLGVQGANWVHDCLKIDELTNRVKELEAGIREHCNQKADDRCIEDDDKLYSLIPGLKCDRRVGDRCAMLDNCINFIRNRTEGGGPWVSYAELSEENISLKEKLIEKNDELIKKCDELMLCINEKVVLIRKQLLNLQTIEHLKRELDSKNNIIDSIKILTKEDQDD